MVKKSTLPKYIQPLEMADKGAHIAGVIELQALKRLTEVLAEKTGEVTVDLTLGKDREGLRFLKGELKTDLKLTCQRCLKPVTYPINSVVNLSPVYNDAGAKNLPERYDPLLITEEPLLLADIIEEELLLALPLVAKHTNECL